MTSLARGGATQWDAATGDETWHAGFSTPRDPGVLVAPMGWWNSDYPGGRSAQATTSELLTAEGNAPTFNDNRVEVEPSTTLKGV